jgi:hypothetical protein
MERSAADCRALGPALLGLLEYLRVVSQPPFRPQAAAVKGDGVVVVDTTATAAASMLPPAQSPLRLMTFLAGAGLDPAACCYRELATVVSLVGRPSAVFVPGYTGMDPAQ